MQNQQMAADEQMYMVAEYFDWKPQHPDKAFARQVSFEDWKLVKEYREWKQHQNIQSIMESQDFENWKNDQASRGF